MTVVATLSVRLLWFGAIIGDNGSISDKKSTGRPRSSCNERHEERVRNAIFSSPKRLAVRYLSILGLIHRGTRRMLKHMTVYPYEIAIT